MRAATGTPSRIRKLSNGTQPQPYESLWAPAPGGIGADAAAGADGADAVGGSGAQQVGLTQHIFVLLLRLLLMKRVRCNSVIL